MGKEDLLISSLSEVNLDGLSYEPAEFSIVVDATVSIKIAWVSTPQEYGTSNLGPSDWQTDWEGCIGPREEPESGFNWAVTNTLPEDMAFPAEIPRFESRERQVCLRVPITGPTQDTNEILSAIPNLRSNNTYQPGSNASGRLDTAMAWGWRTLSPAWRGKWGSANIPSTDRKKFLVFFSDGYTNIYNSDMDGSNSWGSNEGSETGFEHLVETCQKAKSDNIEIHIITIDPNPNVVSYFEQCATNLDTLHVLPDVDGIESIFENIALGLSQEEPLRLLR